MVYIAAMWMSHSIAPTGGLWQSVVRGLRGRCPHCGEGALFRRYLKVKDACRACGHDLDRYPADDGPAYFTILIVGHLVVAPALLLPLIWQAPLWIVLPAALVPLAAITLAMLPRTKGAVIGALYALRVSRGDGERHTADAP